MKDRRACIFYFLMTIIFFDFANQLRILSANPKCASISNPVFSIVNLSNTGSAFGLFSGLQNSALYLGAIGVLVLLFIAYYVYKNVSFSDKFLLLSATLFSAGALGNIIERFKFGHVIDYIKLNFIDFPVFNAFDIMICIAVFIYIIYTLSEIRLERASDDN